MRLQRLLGLVLILAGLSSSVQAQSSSTASLEVTPFFGGAFKVGQWLPLRIIASNNGADLQATVRVGGTSGATYDAVLDLPQGSRKTLVMYVRPDSFAHSLQARLMVGEQELAKARINVDGRSVTTALVGVLSTRPMTAPLPVAHAGQTRVATFMLDPNDLPTRAEGLSSLDIVIFDKMDWSKLSAEQVGALDDWVRTGGQLIATLPSDQQEALAIPPSFAIATGDLVSKQRVEHTLLAKLGADSSIDVLSMTPRSGASLIDALTIQKDWGQGRVTALGFSLSDPVLQQLPDSTQLWQTLLRLQSPNPNLQAGMTIDDMQTQQIAQALYNLPTLALPPMNILAVLLFLYILLIGPGLYFVLRRIDRQAWAWVAIPALTLIFSGVAYGYGMSIRGNDLILDQITLIQSVGERARVRTFAGIFSPRSQSYDITIDGDALTRPLFFDPKVWGGDPNQTTSGNFIQSPPGVQNLNIAQWSMGTFAAEARLTLNPLTSTLELSGGTLRGTVRNLGSVKLRDVALIQANHALMVGDLEPGAEKQVTFQIDKPVPQSEPISMRLFRDRWSPATGPVPEIRTTVQLIDTLYGYMPWGRPSRPIALGWLDATPLPIHLKAPRVQYQQTTLVEAIPTIRYSDEVALPNGWTQTGWENSQSDGGTCMTQWGDGVVLNSDILTATVQLPTVVDNLTITQATLTTRFEGPALARLLLEVYDHQAGAWTSQSERLGNTDLSDPQRFVTAHTLLARIKVPSGNATGGCLNLDLALKGHR